MGNQYRFTMSSTSTATNVCDFFNKSKEDFIWFIKRATSDRKSSAHAELYHCLLKMFVEADTNNDGLVGKESFSKLLNLAASIRKLYGYGPSDAEVEDKAMFDSMDLKKTGVITFDEWYKFSMEHLAAKTATLTPHPILDLGNKEEFLGFLKTAIYPGTTLHTELYWFLVEIFTEGDSNKDGIVTKRAFPAMVDKVLKTPKQLDVFHPDKELFEEDEDLRIVYQDKLFNAAIPRGDDRMTVDEWVKFAMEKVFFPMTPYSSGFNKSKEDFIWFIKKAVGDKKSYAHSELYHCLLKMFADADTNNDGLVSRATFSKLVDIAASIPRLYGYAPVDTELYKTEEEKELAEQKMFDSMDLKASGVITFDEWVKFCQDHIVAKTATLEPHPILDCDDMEKFKAFVRKAVQPGTAENTELYWYLLEFFTDCDTDMDGIVVADDFPSMVDRVLSKPKELGYSHVDIKPLVLDDLSKRKENQLALFKKFNPRSDGRMCVDEWMSLAMEAIFKKVIE